MAETQKQIDNLYTDLNKEVERATSRENSLEVKINKNYKSLYNGLAGEIGRAITKENTLERKINNNFSGFEEKFGSQIEQSREAESKLSNWITSLDSAPGTGVLNAQITKETLRAIANENRIEIKAENNLSRHKESTQEIINELIDRLEAEVEESREVESKLITWLTTLDAIANKETVARNLMEEILRAKATEGDLDTLLTSSRDNLVSAINSEHLKNNEATKELTNLLNNEVSRATTTEGKLADLGTSTKTNLVSAINEVKTNLDNETTRATTTEGKLSNLTTTSKTNLVSAINELDKDVGDINTFLDERVPTAANSNNQLADKNWVNDSIETNSAHFLGTIDTKSFATIDPINDKTTWEANVRAKLNSSFPTATNNDYAFVNIYEPVDDGDPSTNDYSVATYQRWKCSVSGKVITWKFEYTLNNTGYTNAQWEALNSEMTFLLRKKLVEHMNTKTGNPHKVTKAEVGLGSADNTPDKDKLVAGLIDINNTSGTIKAGSTILTTSTAVSNFAAFDTVGNIKPVGIEASRDLIGKVNISNDGLVPKCLVNTSGKYKFLREDGTWNSIELTDIQVEEATDEDIDNIFS